MKLNGENASKFIGKWCLWDKNHIGQYDKLFINDVKSNLVEYSYDKKSWQYADLSLFDHGDLIVSPFKEIKTNDGASQDNQSNATSHSSYFLESVTRCANDQHDWTEADLMCWPSKKAQICKKCGIMKYDK